MSSLSPFHLASSCLIRSILSIHPTILSLSNLSTYIVTSKKIRKIICAYLPKIWLRIFNFQTSKFFFLVSLGIAVLRVFSRRPRPSVTPPKPVLPPHASARRTAKRRSGSWRRPRWRRGAPRPTAAWTRWGPKKPPGRPPRAMAMVCLRPGHGGTWWWELNE